MSERSPKSTYVRFSALASIGLFAVVAIAGCEGASVIAPGTGPAPPLNLDARYYAYAVELSWEISEGWNGEPFRIYGKRSTDPEYFRIAEVTGCANGFCEYDDLNITPGVSYQYFVSAVDDAGRESSTGTVGPISVPEPTPPPVPSPIEAIALDGAAYVAWGAASRDAGDFSFYRVYLEGGDGSVIFLGETDSEGFLDLRVENGNTYGYFLTAVDDQGHESNGSLLAEVTPRPDYHGEVLLSFQDDPELSGFRFQVNETDDPIVRGDAAGRHFRLEADDQGWWLVPGPGVEVHEQPTLTTSLRCGPASDAACVDVSTAPSEGYLAQDFSLVPDFSYILRVPAGEGGWRYGVVRVSHVGDTQDGAIAIFDWSYQIQTGNRNLAPGPA